MIQTNARRWRSESKKKQLKHCWHQGRRMINTPLAQRGKRSFKIEYVDTLVIFKRWFRSYEWPLWVRIINAHERLLSHLIYQNSVTLIYWWISCGLSWIIDSTNQLHTQAHCEVWLWAASKNYLLKLRRVYGGCLGANERWRTWQTAKIFGEPSSRLWPGGVRMGQPSTGKLVLLHVE